MIQRHWVAIAIFGTFLNAGFVVNQVAWANDVPDLLEQPDVSLLRESGKLFTVEFSKSAHHIVIKAAGTNTAVIDGKNVTVYGYVLNNNSKNQIRIERDQKSRIPRYDILDPIGSTSTLELDVKDASKNATEVFKFKLK